MSAPAFVPHPEDVAHARVTRLMRALGCSSVPELHAASISDIAGFWDAVVKDLAIEFATPYDRVVDLSSGPMWATWFSGGRISIVENCVDRWASSHPARTAVLGQGEDGRLTTMSFAELESEVRRVGGGLTGLGVSEGDAVGLLLPMIPEAVIALYATLAIGAVAVPTFSGFGADAIAARLQDCDAVALVTADATMRRGREDALKAKADAVARLVPTLQHVVVVGTRRETDTASGRDVGWKQLEGQPPAIATREAEHPALLTYTSGTTGRPKGAVHVHGGFLVKAAAEFAYHHDVREADRFCWLTDLGWLMGPLSIVGANANGAAVVMAAGAPDWPSCQRPWLLAEQCRLTQLGLSPTLVRSLMAAGSDSGRHDLGSLRSFGCSGEPLDPTAHSWLLRVRGGRAPVINVSGGTEVGTYLLGSHTVEPAKLGSVGGPSLGVDLDVLDDAGTSILDSGAVGELVVRQPWPGMTRGLFRDPDRYLETYWSTYPGVWRHGDWARVDQDGYWYVLGRSDDTINVAGKRVGPSEVERVLLEHPGVREAAVVGVPDEVKGELIWAFIAGRVEDRLERALADLVADRLGRPFRPACIVEVAAIPKTRSGKVMRRCLRALALGEDAGDLSSAEDPDVAAEVRRALDRLGRGA